MFKSDKEFIKQYLITALWSSFDDYEEPLEDNYELRDISLSSIKQAVKDCLLFISKADELDLIEDYSIAGHDFWLTRNRHGAGFWDGDYEEETGEKLTELSQEFREVHPYVGDDGKIYIE